MKLGNITGLMRVALLATLGAMVAPMVQAADLSVADNIAIQQLYARYNTTIDRGDAEGWAATFTPDGAFMNNKGTEALKAFVNTWHAGTGAAQRHFSADLVITASADGATGTVSTMLVSLSTKPASIAAYVTYSDVLVKTAAGWRFKSRTLKAETAPAAAATGAVPPRPAGQ